MIKLANLPVHFLPDAARVAARIAARIVVPGRRES